ncbi:MAG TPA: cupin domain-containing protein [Leptospiraceae bacterium]|nr:cupin domain-containing protein [Leptospirales bacterium]HMU85656.1 cupin domain-containing protein [Leptospiraceae bacterium]HMW60058.1 cupin domain-containing protein [Leptospiraceae bacterium]HMX58723.1 cupin domain-containing protein [Leptospiraceae bacterium]HMY47770.1 cupin domain-containing protein [Leptospiraceae bacterium]
MPPGVRVVKWPHKETPDEESVKKEMAGLGYRVYDLQTIPPWFERSRHSHDYDEIRGAVEGVTTFHFDDGPVTLEAGDILFIPAGVPHEVRTHNDRPFTAYKASISGERVVTEHGDGKGSVEDLQARS